MTAIQRWYLHQVDEMRMWPDAELLPEPNQLWCKAHDVATLERLIAGYLTTITSLREQLRLMRDLAQDNKELRHDHALLQDRHSALQHRYDLLMQRTK